MYEPPAPDRNTIEQELIACQECLEALAAGVKPLPGLPGAERCNTPALPVLYGMLLNPAVCIIGWAAKHLHLHAVRIWAARCRLWLDPWLMDPSSCWLNRSWTELGLAYLARGDSGHAQYCLTRSWQVHPGIFNIFRGMDARLWHALKLLPEAQAACAEYAYMAQKFCLVAEWPRPVPPLWRRLIRNIPELLSHGFNWLKRRWRQ